MQHSARLVLAAALLALHVAACEAREGSSCRREGAGRCTDSTRALICRNGSWQGLACRGATGCVATQDALACDQRAAREGEGCLQIGQRACRVEQSPAVLICPDATKVWTREAVCLGPAGCHVDGGSVGCDDSLGAVGELCVREGQLACSVDHRTLLRCESGRFSLDRACVCGIGDAGVTCD